MKDIYSSNPGGIGKWLRAQCEKSGVEIRTGLEAVKAQMSPQGRIEALVCLRKNYDSVIIPCDALLVACGSWTPIVFRSLFPRSNMDFSPNINASDWIVCKNPCQTTRTTVAFVSFQKMVGEKMEFAARNDGTIWACGRRNYDVRLPEPGEYARPDKGRIQELLDYARDWLNVECRCGGNHVLELLDQGRSFRPATLSSIPLLTEVAADDLIGAYDSSTVSGSSGVFINWGHGSYGLTLSMGSGKLMSQMIRGEPTDLDVSLFARSKSGLNVVKSSKML